MQSSQEQCDQIGRNFTSWVIVYLGSFVKIAAATFYTVKVMH
jgi:hypothetical protein